MAKRKGKPPIVRSGQRFFRVANLDHADPEKRKQVLGNIVDLIDKQDEQEQKQSPPAQDQNEKPPQ